MAVQETVASLMKMPGVRMAAVVGRDGSVLAVSHQEPVSEVVAALSSAIFGAIASALAKGGVPPLDACLLEAGNTSIQLHSAGDRILVAVAANDANVGRLKLALRRAAERDIS
ncbi:MAG TPA: roadblock/LC7 domain-containing protein [Chloroflexota bacterium]|nr:roadblock/LC7 domain-containing protein [Chloroflexota bacterium]